MKSFCFDRFSSTTAKTSLFLAFWLMPWEALAHHGVAGVGVAGLNGPGAPIESASSSVLPEGKTLAYFKMDNAQYKTWEDKAPNEKSARFSMLGLGHGFAPWFSAYAFLPFHEKESEDEAQTSKGVADMSLMGQIGFKYDKGFGLIPANESLDDLEDWHFSLFFGGTIPTGKANHTLGDGSIDPGKSHGFGKPSYSLGLTASKMLTDRLTLNMEASALRFQEYTYDSDVNGPGKSVRFGTEDRFNIGMAYRALTLPEQKFRLDPILEIQHLSLGRDFENGEAQESTGGRIVYAVPGFRAYWQNMSFALGLKTPVTTQLNESDDQQGTEGKEKYRLIFSISAIF